MVLLEHTAPGPTAGALFQPERALYWLAESGPGAKVGIETCDDITMVDNNIVVLEQDKHSIQPTGQPLGDASTNLWKTLKTWLDAVANEEIVLEKTKLYIVTNKQVPEDSLACCIGKAIKKDEVSLCISKMRAIGKQSQQVLIRDVLKYTDFSLGQIIERVSVLDSKNNSCASELHEVIISKLHIPPEFNSQDIIHQLLGWMVATTLQLWRVGKQAWISREAFDRELYHIIWRHTDRLCGKELAKHLIPVSKNTIQEHQNNNFVQQLALISIDESDDEYFEAIADFIRCNAERNRLSREGHLVEDDLISFDERLLDRWSIIFRKRRSQLKDDSGLKDKVQSGISTYYDTLDHREPLAGRPTEEFYLTRGSYHRLADSGRVGWHPDYSSLFPEVIK